MSGSGSGTTSAPTTPTPGNSGSGGSGAAGWDTNTYPTVTYGVVVGFLLLIAFCAAVLGLMKFRGGSLRNLLCFHFWHNLGLAILAFNACLMMLMGINLALFADANASVLKADPPHYLEKNGDAFIASAVGLCMEALLSVLLAAASVRCVGPWEGDAWEARVFMEGWLVRALQFWAFVVFFIAWLGRGVLITCKHHYDNLLEMPEAINNQIVGEVVTGFFETAFVLVWFARYTWCRPQEYVPFTCPVCDGKGTTTAVPEPDTKQAALNGDSPSVLSALSARLPVPITVGTSTCESRLCHNGLQYLPAV